MGGRSGPAHHTAEEYIEAYFDATGLRPQKKAPLFQTVNRGGELTGSRLDRVDVFRMIKRRARQAGLPKTALAATLLGPRGSPPT